MHSWTSSISYFCKMSDLHDNLSSFSLPPLIHFLHSSPFLPLSWPGWMEAPLQHNGSSSLRNSRNVWSQQETGGHKQYTAHAPRIHYITLYFLLSHDLTHTPYTTPHFFRRELSVMWKEMIVVMSLTDISHSHHVPNQSSSSLKYQRAFNLIIVMCVNWSAEVNSTAGVIHVAQPLDVFCFNWRIHHVG